LTFVFRSSKTSGMGEEKTRESKQHDLNNQNQLSNLNYSEILELHKERYLFETDRKNRLLERIGIHLTMTTMILGIIGFMLLNLYIFRFCKLDMVFYLFLLITIIFFIGIIVYSIKSFFSYEYFYLPGSIEINKHLIKLDDHYNNPYFDEKDKTSMLRKDIDQLFADYYCKAAEANMRNNEKRSACIHKATKSLICALIALTIALALFFWKYTTFKYIEVKQSISMRCK